MLKIKKIIKFLLPVALFSLFFCMVINFTEAAQSGSPTLGGVVSSADSLGNWDKFLQGELPSFRTPSGATGEDMAAGVVRRAVSLIKFILGGLALILGIIYAMGLIFSMGKEESITKYKKNFLWIFVGFIVIMAADSISTIFNPETAESDALINFSVARDQLRDMVNYIKWLIGSVIVLLMTISGIRMITAGEKEETITKEKTHLVWSGLGMLTILLASNIVNAIYVIKSPDSIVAGSSTSAINEIGSVLRLLLVFLGPIAVIFTIYAGFMYLTSFDNEERSKKARTMIVGGVTGIVMIYSAYALVNTFMVAKLVS